MGAGWVRARAYSTGARIMREKGRRENVANIATSPHYISGDKLPQNVKCRNICDILHGYIGERILHPVSQLFIALTVRRYLRLLPLLRG